MAVQLPYLQKLKPGEKHVFKEPVKRIHVPNDVDTFLCSLAYGDIMTFLQQLNRAMVPAKLETGKAQSWELTSDEITFSEPVKRISGLLAKLNALIDETPPSKEPRRFGNSAFRTWHASLRGKFSEWFSEIVSPGLSPEYGKPEDKESAYTELQDYFLGGFGSAQRLDYGTGHELSFLAFLGGLWKLRFFEEAEVGVEERAIVVRIIEPYIRIVRRLIKTYTLEPAGSHGVWGLDDHCFVPYIFGSAQYCPPVKADQLTPVEGSMTNAPEPGDVVKRNLVEKLKDHNMYFSAIGFIYDVKKGPFWEHSPILFDISGIRDGWGKINKVSHPYPIHRRIPTL
ncbi:Serine/threonine-protein phosphatase 2A activator 1 [Ascosphaera atra]|nr:Serine/threonine-protein phosphatase 2A activator 1 [Ascosphaera atra]